MSFDSKGRRQIDKRTTELSGAGALRARILSLVPSSLDGSLTSMVTVKDARTLRSDPTGVKAQFWPLRPERPLQVGDQVVEVLDSNGKPYETVG